MNISIRRFWSEFNFSTSPQFFTDFSDFKRAVYLKKKKTKKIRKLHRELVILFDEMYR